MVRDVMGKKLETIKDSASVQETAKKLKDKGANSLIVVDSEGKSEGLVTERDIVTKICINDTGASSITNKPVMSEPLITVDSACTQLLI